MWCGVKSLLVVRFDAMNLFWTLFLCALGFQSTVQLLPKTVIPLNYKLDLYMNFEGKSVYGDISYSDFSGRVVITIRCLNKTDTITLHSKNLRITMAHITHDHHRFNVDGDWLLPHDQKKDLVTLRIPADLEKNNVYRVEIGFIGEFEEVLKEGFFLSRSKNPTTNETVYNATSYLQNGKARKVFPCFDEPEFKTPFEIMVEHAPKYKAISNMPADHTESKEYMDQYWVRTYFKKTAPLSTDQVTFAVFESPKLQSTNTSTPPLTITTPVLSLGRGIRKKVKGGLKGLLD